MLHGNLVIDSEYKIVSFNDAALALYPHVCNGIKCYKAIAGREEVCPECTLFGGAFTSTESAGAPPYCDLENAVELPLSTGSKGYIVPCVANEKSRAIIKKILNEAKQMQMLGIVSSLTGDMKDLYEVDNKTQMVKVHRFSYNAKGVLEAINQAHNYANAMRAYIENNVHPDDKEEMLRVTDFGEILQRVKKEGTLIYHYRVLRNNEIHYYYMKCTKSDPGESFKSVIMAFVNEDDVALKNNLVINNVTLSQNSLHAQAYEARFADAIKNKEFVVWYQPKYDAYTEKVVGAEGLIRWETPNGMISPGDFLDVFEADGLIEKLDEYVFREVCEQQRRWKEQGRPLVPVSVNISRKSLFAPDVVKRYKEIIEKAGIDPSLIPIEITENVALANRRIKPIADQFFEAGFELHMDDFGSGRSSLNGLNMMHFEVVKLDKSLIDFIGNKNGDLILHYTLALGKDMGLRLVAEGVETEQQLNFLKANGCEMIQGFYFSKPLPVSEFEKKAKGNIASTKSSRQKRKMQMESRELFDYSLVLLERGLSQNEHMPGGFFAYEAFDEERILSSNSYLWELFGCHSEQEFMEHVHGSFKGIVAPEDLERVESSIAKQITDSDRDMDYVEYDIIRKDGKRLNVVDYGHLTHVDGKPVFYVFISDEKQDNY